MEDIQVIDPTGRHERPILTVVTDKLPGPPLNILNLPHELQICILSHLPIAGQIFAGMVCRLWEDIIVNSRSFTKARYHGPDENGYQNRHKLLTHPGGLLCLVQSGRVEGYCFPLDGDDVDFPIDYTNYNSKILTAPRLDIAKCKLLDEPMSSPFVEEVKDNPDDALIVVGRCICRHGIFSRSKRFPRALPRKTTIREFLSMISTFDTFFSDFHHTLAYVDEDYCTSAAYDNDLPHRLVLRGVGGEGQARDKGWHEAIVFFHSDSESLDCQL